MATFDEVYRQYLERIERYLRFQKGHNPEDVQELADDVFVLAYQKWESIKRYDERHLIGWLYKTADLKSREHLRKQKAGAVTDSLEDYKWNLLRKEDEAPILSDDLRDYETAYREFSNEIKKRLTPIERQIFECIVEKEQSYDQMAKALHLTEINIKVRWHRIRKKIKRLLPDIL